MDIIWGEAVASTDAWFGRLDGVLMVLDGHEVTHLIVKRGSFFSKRLTVSIGLLRRCDSEGIYLDLPTSELLDLSMARNTPREQFILGLDSRTSVLVQDGESLRLKGLRLSGDRGTVSHLIAGGPGHRSVLLSINTINNFSSGQITTDIGSKAALNSLPTHRRDHFIESDLWESLYASDSVSDTDLKGIEAHVEDGIITLRGNVRTSSAVTEIAELAQSVDGVAKVRSELISDWDVELAVAAYISKNARELAGSISAHSQLGLVTLTGHAPSEGSKASVAQGVACLGGVRGVIDRIEVQPEPSTHPDAEDGMPEEGVVSGEREAVEG